MTALKLFVSHSSRLDDIEHKYTDNDRNWRLLKETCEAIKARYGDRVEVLVDQNGLVPGDKWNDKLNLWLAECHAAVILFSKRAIEKSDWVAKEAAILSWRAELDDRFTFIPVLLDGETTPADLVKDFFGVLRIDQNQCISDAYTPKDIVTKIVRALGKPKDLKGAYPSTPLERLQGGIAKLLSEQTTEASILAALDEVGCQALADGTVNRQRYADLLAHQLLEESDEKPLECFNLFQRGSDPLEPKPSRELIYSLFMAIRPLWVDPRAAACLPLALVHKKPVVLAGSFVNNSDPDLLEVRNYTLERYLERAWARSNLAFDPVTLTRFDSFEQIQKDVRESLLDPIQVRCGSPEKLDKWINENPKRIIVVATPTPDKGTLPDIRQRKALSKLSAVYHKAVVILDLGIDHDRLPVDIEEVKPPINTGLESEALFKERDAQHFADRFGTST